MSLLPGKGQGQEAQRTQQSQEDQQFHEGVAQEYFTQQDETLEAGPSRARGQKQSPAKIPRKRKYPTSPTKRGPGRPRKADKGTVPDVPDSMMGIMEF
ncbi:hypothetical protein N7520_008110 [Penicillium odoratum]|uniref:uncharacterized protein n=1 Tax=Penicillium odoratum TaxID=1167516 RepID=UPI00254830F2|nr:uncharacterized protein N7520_008110 [Penicillium odoratum]KAJ5760954.1 hypothetical protein N7520_008110 [Penicillium odoratum]